jgi:hypothetical protein
MVGNVEEATVRSHFNNRGHRCKRDDETDEKCQSRNHGNTGKFESIEYRWQDWLVNATGPEKLVTPAIKI